MDIIFNFFEKIFFPNGNYKDENFLKKVKGWEVVSEGKKYIMNTATQLGVSRIHYPDSIIEHFQVLCKTPKGNYFFLNIERHAKYKHITNKYIFIAENEESVKNWAINNLTIKEVEKIFGVLEEA